MVSEQETRRFADNPLHELAELYGVATEYEDQQGHPQYIGDEVLVRVLGDLGVAAQDGKEIARSLEEARRERADEFCPPTILQILGKETRVELGRVDGPVTVRLVLEDGRDLSQSVRCVSSVLLVGDDVPMGYHTLSVSDGVHSADSTLITAPQRIPLPQSVADHPRWGWMAQLYSVRSKDSWGIGDFCDLQRLLTDAASKSGADFMLINPIHASEPVSPLTPSPYFPDSRIFLNPIYIRPEDIPEFARLDSDDRSRIADLLAKIAPTDADVNVLDRDGCWANKQKALRIIHDQVELTPERAEKFKEFVQSGGEELEGFALWCLAYCWWGAPTQDEGSWFRRESPSSPSIQDLKQEHPDDFDFCLWMQWMADQQLSAAQRSSKAAGMSIGLMEDMAVGVNPLGADVWSHPSRYASGATVGAPPDAFNQQGQNWMQPPLDPNQLRKSGYRAYRQLVHGMFAHCGAIRIDHALGLFRLWWIPSGAPASQGTYVYYDHDAMLSILAIEATRVNGIVIGEDLGVVPKFASKALADRGVLGTIIEWFEQKDGEFVDPARYRAYALAAVTTHDLPPTAGYLDYEHVRLREDLGLLVTSPEEFERSARQEHAAMIRFLVAHGWLSPQLAADEEGHLQEIVEAMHRAIVHSPCLLRVAALVDGVGEQRSQNQPGTVDEYPNWRVPLADGDGRVVYADQVFDLPRVQSLAAVMRGED